MFPNMNMGFATTATPAYQWEHSMDVAATKMLGQIMPVPLLDLNACNASITEIHYVCMLPRPLVSAVAIKSAKSIVPDSFRGLCPMMT